MPRGDESAANDRARARVDPAGHVLDKIHNEIDVYDKLI
jgi:hypothetical protein